MKDNLTELVFILDRSGSMRGLEADTIGGYNSFIEKQKNEAGSATLTTVLFDDRYEIIHDRVDLKKVEPLSQKQYFVRGSTALLDAVGRTIDRIGECLNSTSEQNRPSKVIFVITTDGMENASRQYSAERVKNMITHQTQKYNWEFLFLGANIDAVGVASDMGIRPEMAANFKASSKGITKTYDAINEAITTFRSNAQVTKNWKSTLQEPADT